MRFAYVLHFCNTFAAYASTMVVALYAAHLGADAVVIGVLIAVSALAPAVLGVHAGRLSDRFGVRTPMLSGSALMAAGLVLAAVSGEMPVLFVAVVVLGAGFVVYMVAQQSLVGAISTKETRARNFTNQIPVATVARFVGPLVTGWLIERFGYAAAFQTLAYVGTLAAVLSVPALAGNGLNLIGFGAESVLMGGADVAVARDTSALNTNPAGLAQIGNRALDVFSAMAYGLDARHRDGFGNDRNVDNKFPVLGSFGYAARISDTKLTLGIGFFAQGGAGNVYKDLNTAFGTVDELSGIFRIARLSPGAAWQATDRLALGISIPITYSDAQQKVFPGTSIFDPANPAASFFGFELKEAHTLRMGFKAGAQYRVSDSLRLGAAYAHNTRLPLSGGKLIANMSAAGLGRVTYRDARVEGLELPREVSLGFAWRPRADWLLSFKYAWLNWADSLRTSTLTASNPDHPLAPPVLSQTADHYWRNQNVFAFGTEIELSPRTKLRAGYNYGRNPIPARNLNPLLAVIGEHHLTAGIVQRLEGEWKDWTLAYGVEYQRGDKAVYTNPALPFGPNAQERSNFPVFDIMLSRRW